MKNLFEKICDCFNGLLNIRMFPSCFDQKPRSLDGQTKNNCQNCDSEWLCNSKEENNESTGSKS